MHTSKNALNVIARMAELVDALVSKTNEVTLVPVRSRLRVREFYPDQLIFNWLGFFVFGCYNNFIEIGAIRVHIPVILISKPFLYTILFVVL